MCVEENGKGVEWDETWTEQGGDMDREEGGSDQGGGGIGSDACQIPTSFLCHCGLPPAIELLQVQVDQWCLLGLAPGQGNNVPLPRGDRQQLKIPCCDTLIAALPLLHGCVEI